MHRDDLDSFADAVAPDEDIRIPDGLEEAFLGISTEEEPPRAVFSIDKCIEILSKDMPVEEAEEYFWYNVAGAGGDGYHLFIATPDE